MDAVLIPIAFELITIEDEPHHSSIANENHPEDEDRALLEAHASAAESLKNAGYIARVMAQRSMGNEPIVTGPKKRRINLDSIRKEMEQ